MPSIGEYWLSQWLDEYEIHSDWEIDRVLFRDFSSVDRLKEIANEAASKASVPPPDGSLGESIVAGSRLDLSARITCGGFDCMRAEVDSAFKNIWHYFDSVVVEGMSPVRAARRFGRSGRPEQLFMLLRTIANQLQLLLYLRDIGAGNSVIFLDKPFGYCEEHWGELAKRVGLFEAFHEGTHDKVIKKLAKHTVLEYEWSDVPPSWTVRVSGDFFEEPLRHVLPQPDRPDPEEVIRHIVADYASRTIADVELSRELSLPLIEPAGIPWVTQRSANTAKQPIAEAVALELNLPVLADISVKDFLKFRNDESPYFERYRAALRTAISERLTPENASKSSAEIARSIEADYLRPGLAEIERQFRSNRKALTRKSSASVAVGTATAVIGALTAMPLLIGSAVAAASLVPVFHKYQDDRTSIEMSDLYFLWHLQKKARHS